MSFFTAAFLLDDDEWSGCELDFDDVESVLEVGDIIDQINDNYQVAVAIIEREDQWFALIRFDQDEDPRVFVSDEEAARTGHFAEVLNVAFESASRLDGEVDGGVVTGDGDEVLDESPLDPDEEIVEVEEFDDEVDILEDPPEWVGSAELFTDLGMPRAHLVSCAEDNDGDPATALEVIAETVGFLDAFEGLR